MTKSTFYLIQGFIGSGKTTFSKKLAKEMLKQKYDIENLDVETLELFNAICVRRGFLRRGGDYDYERCATAIIDDFRKGRIGKIILD